jgi:hypothetical protein
LSLLLAALDHSPRHACLYIQATCWSALLSTQHAVNKNLRCLRILLFHRDSSVV